MLTQLCAAAAAVLESQAFGAYRPDYAAALKAKDNQDPLSRGETLHHEPDAAAAAEPDPDPDLDRVKASKESSERGPEEAAVANGVPQRPAAAGRGRAGVGAQRCAMAMDVQVTPCFSGKVG